MSCTLTSSILFSIALFKHISPTTFPAGKSLYETWQTGLRRVYVYIYINIIYTYINIEKLPNQPLNHTSVVCAHLKKVIPLGGKNAGLLPSPAALGSIHKARVGNKDLRVGSIHSKKWWDWKGFSYRIHPGRLTWNLQITHLERKMIFQTSMIMFHVNLPGCRT